MNFKNTQNTWGAGAKFFHWTIALLIIGLICAGLYMTSVKMSPGVLKIFFLHKSFGITVLALATLRVLWKLCNVRPAYLANHQAWEKFLAKLTHLFLYFAMFAMPLSGWVMSSAKNFHVSVFNLFILPDIVKPDKNLAHLAVEFHEYVAWILIGMIGLHAAGALKHHVIDKDSTLRRMLPFVKSQGEKV